MGNPSKRVPSRRLNIALIGYGKMGKIVEQVALSRGHQVVAKIDPKGPDCHLNGKTLEKAEICIDFSHPNSVLENIKILTELKKDIVIGTTGWYEHLSEAKKLVQKYSVGMFYSSNFAIGVNVFLKLVKQAAELMDPHEEFDVACIEWHHRAKVDAPSGTALAMGQEIVSTMQRKKKIVTALDKPLASDEVQIGSIRCGQIYGVHTVQFESPLESIVMTHTSKGREGFAQGAVRAAEWVFGKKGIFNMGDL